MAQTIKLKRSAVSGRVPTTSDLALGEVGLNTTDGKLFIKKSLNGTESIVDVGNNSAYLPLLGGTLTGDLNFGDNNKANFGSSNDLRVYHDNTYLSNTGASFIEENGTGNLIIKGSNIEVRSSTNELYAQLVQDGVVQLACDNVVKFSTTSEGINVIGEVKGDSLEIDGNADITGNITLTGNLNLGASDKAIFNTNFEIYRDASNAIISETGAGSLILRGTNLSLQSDDNDQYIQCVENGAVTLYHQSGGNSSPKIETSSSGASISGDITVTGTVDGRDVATDGTKLDGIEASADVTDTTNVTAAGALMDSEVTNLAQVKAFDSSDYATSAQGTTADNALPKSGGTLTGNLNLGASDKAIFNTNFEIYRDASNAIISETGAGSLILRGTNLSLQSDDNDQYIQCVENGAVTLYHQSGGNSSPKIETSSSGASISGDITVTGTVDGRDVATDGTKLDGIAENANNYVLPSGYATETYVNTQVTNLVDSSPATLNTLNELAAALGDDPNFATTTATSIGTKLALSGGSLTGDLNLGASDKVIFNNNFEIYRDASNSIISETGAGSLILRGTNLSLQSDDNDQYLQAIENGGVTLYHQSGGNSAPKLATTATGIDVTGTATMDGLVTQATANTYPAGAAIIKSLAGDNTYVTNVGGSFLISNSSTTDQFVLSSAGNVNIPNGSLMVGATTAPSTKLHLADPSTNGIAQIAFSNDAREWRMGVHGGISDAFTIYDHTGSATRMTIDSSGNMGLAKSSLTTWSSGYNALQIGGRGFVGAHTGSDLYVGQNASFNGGWKYQDSTAASMTQHSGGKITQFVAPAGTAGNAISWTTAIDIDSAGRVGIGGSPSKPLHLKTSSGWATMRLEGASDSGGELEFYKGSTKAGGIFFDNSNNLNIRTGNTPVFSAASNGNINIPNGSLMVGSTTAPSKLLHLSETSDGTKLRMTLGGVCEWDFSIGNTSTLTGVGSGALELLPLNTGTANEFAIGTAGTTAPLFHLTNSQNYFAKKVGIGNDSPDRLLSLKHASQAEIGFKTGSVSNGALIYYNDSENQLLLRAQESSDSIAFQTGGTIERMKIRSDGYVDIAGASDVRLTLGSQGTAGNNDANWIRGNGNALSFNSAAGNYVWEVGGSPKMTLKADGELLVGKTSSGINTAGHEFLNYGRALHTVTASTVQILNRKSNDGDIALFQKDGTSVGSIGASGGEMYLGKGDTTLLFNESSDAVLPRGTNGGERDGAIQLGSGSNRFSDLYLSGGISIGDAKTVGHGAISLKYDLVYMTAGVISPSNSDGTDNDNAVDLGKSTARFDDIFATNGTIQTSDRNEKQDIESLTEAEERVAVAAKGLLKKFRWKDAVEDKGDDARIHFGIIAQDLQDAFEAEGLDAGRYAMFISTTWTNEDGEEQTRMGVRYSELLAFIISAI